MRYQALILLHCFNHMQTLGSLPSHFRFLSMIMLHLTSSKSATERSKSLFLVNTNILYKDILSTKKKKIDKELEKWRTKLLLSVEWDKSSHTKNRTLTWHFVQERHHQTWKQHPYHLPLFSFFWIWQRLFMTVTKDQHCLVNFDPKKMQLQKCDLFKKVL